MSDDPCPPITSKTQMYGLLKAGLLGSTIPQYSSVGEWLESGQAFRHKHWGVRTRVPGGPCRLNCPSSEVPDTCARPEFAAAGVNISVMIDHIVRVTLWAEVYDLPGGMGVYGVEYPPEGGSWREGMPTLGRHWEGTAARLLLRKHLNENSLDDLYALRDRYAGHVIEFSATETCFGTLPHRNTITWEVRKY